jgi:UDP-N-acetylmuramate dehydrogenase
LDPADAESVSAGSFFTNPIVDASNLERVLARVAGRNLPRPPMFPQPDGRTKIAAAWLIEQAGFAKGFGLGAEPGVRISKKHTLALVNGGAGTARDLMQLARVVRDGVRSAFDVTLEHEPVLFGLSL